MYKILPHQIKNYDKSPLNLYRTDFNSANFRSYLSLVPILFIGEVIHIQVPRACMLTENFDKFYHFNIQNY